MDDRGPGDHARERHSAGFASTGGHFEMVQLWVNLPARAKMGAPGYQTLLSGSIPRVELPGSAGHARVIAGEFLGHVGPARTHTAINVWDLHLRPGSRATLPLPQGHTSLVIVLRGTVELNQSTVLREAQYAHLSRNGREIGLESNNEALLLVLTGEPIDEPIAGRGPFVMNTQAEIEQAYADLRAGRFARLPTDSDNAG